MTETDLRNNKQIQELVSKHFSLEDRSLGIFIKNLNGERVIAPEYADALKGSEDLRIRLKLDSDLGEAFDEGWKLFSRFFSKFVAEYKMTYADFRENKVTSGPNRVKIRKELSSWMLAHPDMAVFVIFNNGFAEQATTLLLASNETAMLEFATAVLDKEDNIRACAGKDIRKLSLTAREAGFKMKLSVVKGGKNVTLYFQIKKFVETKFFTELVDVFITKTLEKIGTVATPKTGGLSIVLSLNFADWLMCSSGEKWNSCLDVDSPYDSAYWAGLPGLITDTNRALIYITDGSKKTKHGVVVDKMIGRSWLILANKNDTKEPFAHFVKEYPGSFGMLQYATAAFPGLNINSQARSFVSRYKFQLLFQKCNYASKDRYVLCHIFNDTLACVINKGVSFAEAMATYEDGGRGKSNICLDKKTDKINKEHADVFGWSNGLKKLIETNSEICDTDSYDSDEDEDEYDDDDGDDYDD